MEDGIKLVIFDLDGTLIKLPVNYAKLRHEIAEILGVDKIDSIIKNLSSIKDDKRKRVFSLWDELELEALPNMKEVAEGIEVYNKFYDKIKCLVTLQGIRVVERILERTGLYFDYIVTREISLVRSEQIKVIVERFGVNPKNILMIGDRESDKDAAETIGCKFTFVKGNAVHNLVKKFSDGGEVI